MKKQNHKRIFCKRITPQDHGQYFFGYYDNPAWSGNEQMHLCHRVTFCNRIPDERDEAELGMIELSSNNESKFISLTRTTTWNFQQGSMLQWHPRFPNEQIVFNDRNGTEARGVIYHIHTGQRHWLDLPVANLDSQGRYALSYHFGRLFPFRPGYGYAGVPDPHDSFTRPQDDGLHLIHLETGQSRCVLTLDSALLANVIAPIFPNDADKLVINHATFNTTGTRILVLIRNIPRAGERRRTAAVTMNPDGTELYLMTTHPLTSHYHWKNDSELIVYAGRPGGDAVDGGLFLWRDRSHDVTEVDTVFFTQDGHCLYSPDRNWLLYDSYPDRHSYRHLYLYDLRRQQGHTLGSYYSQPDITGDVRCDLHPRWNRSGTAISFDSTHEGSRHMYMMDLSDWMEVEER